MDNSIFLKRIEYQGDIQIILLKICADYGLGKYASHVIISVGYEDLNIVLLTDKGKYFVKIFNKERDEEKCRRYVEIVTKILEAGIQHPKLFQSSQGYLYSFKIDSIIVRLCVMEYVDGKSLYDLRAKVTKEEARFLIGQAALIHQIDFQPTFVYDVWAIVNILKEYEKKKQYIIPRDQDLVKNVIGNFSALDINVLPHRLVHGDMITPNIIKDRLGKLYIVDFSVANYYPRIQELAVLLCNIFFDEVNPGNFLQSYNFLLSEYQKHIPLTLEEISAMPVYTNASFAMHIIGASYEKFAKMNNTVENDYWLELGRIGLRHVSKLCPG